jgi:tetratricopeptide (TPR) repeat protein
MRRGTVSRNHFFRITLLFLLAGAMAVAQNAVREQQGILPITTKSAPARQLFVGGLVKLQNLHGPEAMQDLRKAIQLDPDFALANIMISFESVDPSVDPAEKVAARERAKAAKSKVSRGEQLVIDWLSNSSEGRIVPAIQAMNEVLEQFPNDKFLAWMGAVWVENQQQITRAIPMFERVVQLNPDFAPPLNELAYCYARTRNFEKAFATMQRYITLLPNESNPQDSYAEILRMAGKFDEALVHYRASLKIDPNFVYSQLGIADTYALKGDEPRARAEYALAILHATSKTESATWALQSAITYIREEDLAGADAAFRIVARQAHENDLAVPEAEAYRTMAAYQTNASTAMDLLKKAEEVLQEKHALHKLAQQQELALVLRQRAARAVRDGKNDLAASTLKRLQELADSTHDQVVQIAYEGAAGAVLVAQGKYEEALAHLSEDKRNPLSLLLMVRAYQSLGDKAQADELSTLLGNWNEPTLEHALVVPELRARHSESARSFMRM